MAQMTTSASPDETVRAEPGPDIKGVDFVPERVPGAAPGDARKVLERDGAVILTGWPVEPGSTVTAAAAVLGTRLRELEKVRERATENAEVLTLHRDGAHVVVEVAQQPVRLRLPDPDYVFILGASPAQSGGESVVIDGYRLVERLRTEAPELHAFLTTVDVDVTSAIPHSDIYRIPRVCRMVEWTRGGRMIVRVSQYTQPAPREIAWDEHQRLIHAYEDVLASVASQVQGDTVLAAGDVLVLDNYRCLHGVRPHDGSRSTHVLRCRSADA